jgi:hypothetical protein
MSVAATTGPRPNSSVSEVPDAAMASAMRLGGSHLGVEAAQVVEVLEGERVACHCDGALRLPLGEHALGAGGVDLVGDPAGHELSQQRMQPARGLVPRPAEIVVALRYQPQYPDMVSACDQCQPRCSQGRDRHRQRVVGILLVGAARTQDPHPRRQRRWHVEDGLARGHELLGQEIAQPARGLDRPRPLLERHRPLEQLVELMAARSPPDLRKLRFVTADGDRCVRPLVGIDADHHAHCAPSIALDGAADRCAVAPLSTHTSARSQRASNSLESQTAKADVRHIESQPARTQTLRITRGVALATQSGTYALGPFESTGRRFGGPGHDFRGTVRSRLFD